MAKKELKSLQFPNSPDEYEIVDEIARATKQDSLVSGQNIKTINGQELLGEGNIDLIDSKSDIIYNDLYDTKSRGGQLVSVDKSDGYSGTYPGANFIGLAGYIGHPKELYAIKLWINPNEGLSASKCQLRFYVVPDRSTINPEKPGEDAHNNFPKPNANEWVQKIPNVNITFEQPLIRQKEMYPILLELPEPILNNTDHLFLAVCFDVGVDISQTNIRAGSKLFDEAPWATPAYYLVTDPSNQPLETLDEIRLAGAYGYPGIDDKERIPSIQFETFTKKSIEYYDEIGVKPKDKFATLVDNVTKESGLKDAVIATREAVESCFEKVRVARYDGVGSMDTTIAGAKYKVGSLTSTFTGESIPLGVVATEKPISGVQFIISTRPQTEEFPTTKATKLYFHLYEVERPCTVEANLSFSQLGAVEKVNKIVPISLEPGQTAKVEIEFDEPYINSSNKFLVMGYNLNALFNKTFVSPSESTNSTVKKINGGNYTSLRSYYSISKTNDPYWANKWDADSSLAWSFIQMKDAYIAGDSLNALIDAKLSDITSLLVPTSEVRLAKEYHLVVGDTFQLFYNGVVKSLQVDSEGIVPITGYGFKSAKAYPRYLECTPTTEDIGEHKLKLYTRRFDGSIISVGETKLIVEDVPKFTAPKNLTMLCFGDSLTSSAVWFAEGLRRLVGSDEGASGPASLKIPNLTINTYGNKTNTINTYTVHHEGYGGWTWSSFLGGVSASATDNGIIITLAEPHGYVLDEVQKSIWTDENGLKWELEDFPSAAQLRFNRGTENNKPANTVKLPNNLTCAVPQLSITAIKSQWDAANPFYNDDTGEIDFKNHAKQFNAADPDIVTCLLTWNGGGGELDFQHKAKIDTHIKNATILLRDIHKDFPNAHIIVMGIQISSLTGGAGANYGSAGGYADAYGTAFYAFDYNKALEELVTNTEFGQYCHYVDTKGQFDTINNMPAESKPVNIRSSLKERRGTNGVHPSTDGYYQIGDAFFREMIHVLNIINK